MKKHLLLFVSFILLSLWVAAQPEEEQSIFDYLSGEPVVQLTISANFDSIIANKYQSAYWDATLQMKNDEQVWDIKIKTRGRFRRRICEFPPIKLEFVKQDLRDKGLNTHDDLKLVTHCLNNSISDNFVLREALAYDLYRELTPMSFRYQIIKVTYINTGKKRYKIKRYGILIEDEKDVAKRLEGVTRDTFGLAWNNIQAKSVELAASYQYMIGNTDWSIPMQRNLKFIHRVDSDEWLAIPYDFDMSGLVSPTYGIPNPDLPISSLKERYYQGEQMPSAETIALLKAKKSAILKRCKDFKVLSATHRSEVYDFLDSFFEDLEAGTAFLNEQE
ncbi:MAG: hypothetical protein AAF847_02920 [Bacteroidota bacterium]